MPSRPVVVCDILGTLFPLTPLGPFIQSLISHQPTSTNPPHSTTTLPSPVLLADLLYAELLKDSASLSLAGRYTAVPELMPRLVERVVSKYLYKHHGTAAGTPHPSPQLDAPYQLSQADSRRLQQLTTSLPPRQHAAAFVRRLHDGGCTLVALSNGSAAGTQSLLDTAGLAHCFAGVLSAEQAQAAKPDQRVYGLVEDAGWAGGEVDGAGLVFVSVHSWDCVGVLEYNRAQRQAVASGGTGRRTYTVCYVEQEERRWLLDGVDGGERPAMTAADLSDAATQIEQWAGMPSTTATGATS